MASTTREFAQSLKRLRQRAGLTQERLAEHAGLSRNFIGLLESERREPSLSTLVGLARALSCSLDELVGASRPFTISEAGMDYPADSKPETRIAKWISECNRDERELISGIVHLCVRLSRKQTQQG